MRKALVCQVDPVVSSQLRQDMKQHGWAIDACQGLLEMLRLLENNDYEFVVLGLTLRNVEIHTRLGAIRALDKHPKILLNMNDSEEFAPSSLMFDYPIIKGPLDTEKFLSAMQ